MCVLWTKVHRLWRYEKVRPWAIVSEQPWAQVNIDRACCMMGRAWFHRLEGERRAVFSAQQWVFDHHTSPWLKEVLEKGIGLGRLEIEPINDGSISDCCGNDVELGWFGVRYCSRCWCIQE